MVWATTRVATLAASLLLLSACGGEDSAHRNVCREACDWWTSCTLQGTPVGQAICEVPCPTEPDDRYLQFANAWPVCVADYLLEWNAHERELGGDGISCLNLHEASKVVDWMLAEKQEPSANACSKGANSLNLTDSTRAYFICNGIVGCLLLNP